MKLLKTALSLTAIVASSVATCLAVSAPAQAYRMFLGEDLNSNPWAPAANLTNSQAAEAAFLSNLTGVGTETFESQITGTNNLLNVSFPGAGTATLSGNGRISSVPVGWTNGVGRYAVSGTQFWEVDAGGRFTINFSQQVGAFGFYGVDIGDFGGQLTLTLAGASTTKQVTVNNTIGSSGSTDGSVLFFGIIAETMEEAFSSVSFSMSTGQGDVFAFDNMTVGGLSQVKTPEPSPQPSPEPTPEPTPEPSPEPTVTPEPGPSPTPSPSATPTPQPTQPTDPASVPEPGSIGALLVVGAMGVLGLRRRRAD